MTPSIDINADLGESYGAFRKGDDDALLPYITSANVACGFHGGDPSVMRRTVAAAARRGVAVGAHPGLPDLAGFGRREMTVSPGEAYEMVLYQVGALAAFARAAGTRLSHVKAHGALYNMASRSPALAEAIVSAARDLDPHLAIFGLPGSRMEEAAGAAGMRFVAEAFADRGYAADGSLLPRDQPGALLHDEGTAVRRALRLVLNGTVTAADGTLLHLRPRTVCVHGDGPMAAGLVRGLRAAFESAGVRVAAPGPG